MKIGDLVASKYWFLRWLPMPLGTGGFIRQIEGNRILISNSQKSPGMVVWVRKSWMVEM
jgi:hypothetical protein